MVDLALEQRVDLVLLGGDLIDQDNRFFEAAGPLEKGLARLARADVRVFAVAGNHDHRSLREFAAGEGGANLTLLGLDRGWESVLVKAGGEEFLLHGWSFTKEHHRQSPLDGWPCPPTQEVASVGLVHSDLDAADSLYAPLTRDGLLNTGVDAWVVGHVHKPFVSSSAETPLVLVPGTPQALDPGETGAHGPWLMEIRQRRVSPPVQVPLSTARYEEAAVDLDGIDQEDRFKQVMLGAVRQLEQETIAAGEHLEFLSCRLTLEGRTALHGRLEFLARELLEAPELGSGRIRTLVDKITIQTRPALDPAALAESGGLTSHLAGLILALEKGDLSPEQDRLVRETLDHLSGIHNSGPYLGLDQDLALGRDQIQELLAGQGLLLLEELLGQKD